MNDDDTAAADTKLGGTPDDTTVIPDIRPNQAAPALAWSSEEADTDDFSEDEDDDLDDDSREDGPWTDDDDAAYARGTVKIFVGLIAVAVIGAAWLVGFRLTHRNDAATAVATQTTVAPVLSTADAAFARSLQSEGIDPTGRIDGLITLAQHVCAGIGRGQSKTDITQKIHDRNQDMTQGDAKDFVDSAVEPYCPPR